MAKKYLSLDRLTEYDALLKSQINESDASTLKSAKEYADEKVSSITSGTTVVAKAEEANHAVNADKATNADNATNANHATSADTATNATKATQDASGNVITTTYETKTDASAKLAEAKGYADTAATTAANKVKDDLLNGAGEAYDTLKELGDLITENKDAIDVLEDVATNKANKEHEHTVVDITDYVAPVQADWNQNDPEALDYVKNRPFYENSFETILLDEVSEQFTNDGNPTQIFREGYSFVIGQTYTVILDGTTYECVAWDNGNGIGVIGNAGMIGFGDDTGEPFVGIYLDGVYNIMCSTAGTHTISISGIVSEIKQLDEKFISYKPGARTPDGGEIFNDYVNNVANSGSHAEGFMTTASGYEAHAEGYMTTASGLNSHAEGNETTASEWTAHAEGYSTTASEQGAHAEGEWTTASGLAAHAEGYSTVASGWTAHAEGWYTIAASDFQHVQGQYNIEDNEKKYAHIVGNGNEDHMSNPENPIITRSNAHTLDWDGNAWFAGDVYVGGTSQDDASKLMTETDVDAKIENITTGGITVSNATNAEKAEKDANGNVITSTYETKEDAQAKLDEAKAYTNTMTSGMATTTVVDNKISTHNTSSTAHTDIRDLINALSTKVNNFLDVSDTTTDQLSEVLTLINNNKGTLDSITSNKVNVSDIVDNLTTANASKVLSANQGVVLKGLIDALQEAVDGKSAEGHKHAISDVTDLQTTLNAKAAQTDLDAVEAKANNANTSITNIVNGTTTVAKATNADSAANAEKLGGQLPSYYAAASAIPTGALANKNIVSESDLDSDLADKVNAAAEGNHSHSNKTVLDGITAAKISNWDNAEANAKAHTDEKIALLMNNSSEAVDSVMELAEAMSDNADAIKALETVAASKVPTSRKVNGKDLTADITLSADDVNADTKGSAGAVQTNLDAHIADAIKHITSTERTNWGKAYTHSTEAHAPSNAQENVIESIKVNGTAQTITSKSVNITVPTDNNQLANGAGYITASAIANKADKATSLTGYGITDAYTKSEVDAMTAVDSALSSTSTKPVQNKVVNSAIVTATAAITTNTNSIDAHTTRISALETKVGDGFEEITSTEIQNLFK